MIDRRPRWVRRYVPALAGTTAVFLGCLALLALVGGELASALFLAVLTGTSAWISSAAGRTAPRPSHADRRCPRCTSDEVQFTRVPSRTLAGLVPSAPARRVFGESIQCRCRACGETWRSGTRAGRIPGLAVAGPSPFDETWAHARDPRIRDLRARGITRVDVRVGPEACRSCRRLAGVYDIDEAPLLPSAECSRAGACPWEYAPL